MGRDVVIIGGGPSGLAAAYEAAGQGATVSVFERLDIVGGLARTVAFQGSRFDIGAHRFFTKNAEVQQLFVSLLGDEAVRVARFTRILNDGRYFDYPLTPLNAMMGVGLASGVAITASYAAARLRAARIDLACTKPRIDELVDQRLDLPALVLEDCIPQCASERSLGR